MAEYTPSPQAMEAFKAAWHEADAEGDEGNRVSRGLAAALAQHDAELRAAALAALATMGQGVTAEAVEYAIEGGIPDDLPGYREVYTQRAARRVMALLRHGDADHPSAAVRPSGQEGSR